MEERIELISELEMAIAAAFAFSGPLMTNGELGFCFRYVPSQSLHLTRE